MVIETSALIAILLNEPERQAFIEAIDASGFRLLSVVSYVEVSMVLEGRHGSTALLELDRFLESAQIELVSVDQTQGKLARDAFRRYGKGRHPARLNFGDCFSYALAKSMGEPLLYKGEDFSRTDVVAAK